MVYYTFLTTALLLILALSGALWKSTKSFGFLLGLAALYFWSLHGAWAIVTDQLENDSQSRYQYLFDKMFPVYLDEHYFWALALYLVFILVTGFTALFCISSRRLPTENLNPIRISHDRIILVAGVAALASFWIVHQSLGSALQDGGSAYILTRSTAANDLGWFRIHQVLNRVVLVPTAIGLATLLSGGRCRFLTGTKKIHMYLGYAVVLGGMFCFCVVLGNKNELALALFAGTLFYLANSTRPEIGRIVTCGVVLLTGIAFVDHARRFPIDEIVSNASPSELASALGRLLNSNEAFAAHMSFYGILSFDVPLTYGSSIYTFATSLIPTILWPDKPFDIYWHYAGAVKATEGQGYCIHHAAGWYLNFGIAGVILGGCVLGRLWAALYNNTIRGANAMGVTAWRIFSVIGFFTFTADLPTLIRTGPEGYKGVLIESLILPVVVLTFSRLQQPKRLPRPSLDPVGRPSIPLSSAGRSWKSASE